MEVQTNPALVLIGGRGGNLRGGGSGQNWRKRVGVEPTDDRSACHPPVLKTGTITGPHALPSIRVAAKRAGVQRGRVPALHGSAGLLGLRGGPQIGLDRLEAGEFLLGLFV